MKESLETRYVYKSAWTLQGGGGGNGAFSALGLHVECMGATMYGAGKLLPVKTDLSKTNHPRPTLAVDVRFQNCKQIQKQSGRISFKKICRRKKLDVCQR